MPFIILNVFINKIYKFFKLERKINSPAELLDLPLIEKIANEGLA